MIAEKLSGIAPTQVYKDKERKCGDTYFITMEANWRAWCAYSLLFGSEQGYKRIAERGGFGESELDAFYPEWRNHIVEYSNKPSQ